MTRTSYKCWKLLAKSFFFKETDKQTRKQLQEGIIFQKLQLLKHNLVVTQNKAWSSPANMKTKLSIAGFLRELVEKNKNTWFFTACLKWQYRTISLFRFFILKNQTIKQWPEFIYSNQLCQWQFFHGSVQNMSLLLCRQWLPSPPVS